jgi:ankyrin repeat protein
MFFAALEGNVEVMRYLLDHGGDPAMPNETGSTPLHSAAEEGAFSISQKIEGMSLLAYGYTL